MQVNICWWRCASQYMKIILVPRARVPFGQHQESVQHRQSAIDRLPVTLRMPRDKSDKSDWFWSQSILFTKPFKTRMSLDLARDRDSFADQKERGLWERECMKIIYESMKNMLLNCKR